jgi:hypothetical protein
MSDNQQKMTGEQALSLLSQAAATYQGTREDHKMLIMAEAILLELIKGKEQTGGLGDK